MKNMGYYIRDCVIHLCWHSIEDSVSNSNRESVIEFVRNSIKSLIHDSIMSSVRTSVFNYSPLKNTRK